MQTDSAKAQLERECFGFSVFLCCFCRYLGLLGIKMSQMIADEIIHTLFTKKTRFSCILNASIKTEKA